MHDENGTMNEVIQTWTRPIDVPASTVCLEQANKPAWQRNNV